MLINGMNIKYEKIDDFDVFGVILILWLVNILIKFGVI